MAKIVQIAGDTFLDSDGRMWFESQTNGWTEFATYPPGCDPNEAKDASADILAVLRGVTEFVDRQICRHEETYRGGVLWEVCSQCGEKWADDEGGKPEFIEPPEITRAWEILEIMRTNDNG